MRIARETGTRSPWASRVLEDCGHKVMVANARELRLIYANKRKTDEIDAENLARLARLDPKLLYPVRHRGEGSQAHLALIRSRESLVGCRTQLVNHVRGAVKSFGASLAQVSCQELPQEGLRAHPRGTPAGPRYRLGADRLADRAHPQTMTGSWRRSLKSTTRKPSCCVRSRGSGRLRRSPSC